MQSGHLFDAQAVFLFLLLFVVIFAVIAQRVRVPYPIVLVIAGVLLGVIPMVPATELDPNLVFQVILPPLLFRAAWQTSWITLMRNGWSIFMLAVGLVVFTTLGVAFLAPLFLAGFDWRSGFLLGAVIAPTDAIAATSIARQLGLPRKLVDIIEGESLVNDATGLLALEIGIAMIVTGKTPTISESFERLCVMTAIGIAIGVATGFLVEAIERNVDDPPIVIAITLLIPYGAYFTAGIAHGSGVLAVVACGLVHSYRSSAYRPARVRLQAAAAWSAIEFILNGLVFVLIGLQLRPILRGLAGVTPGALVLYVVLFSALVMALRMAWVFPAMPLGTVIGNRLFHRREECPTWRGMFIVGWSSMRGVIALAAAISLPRLLPDGRPFAARGMIIFLTFGAIFVSLVLKGLTLPATIRGLGLAGTAESEVGELDARRTMIGEALAYLESVRESGGVIDDQYDRLKRRYDARLATTHDEVIDEHGTAGEHARRYLELSRTMISLEREAAVRLRNQRRISEEVLRKLLLELDLEETRLNVQIGRLGGAAAR